MYICFCTFQFKKNTSEELTLLLVFGIRIMSVYQHMPLKLTANGPVFPM